MTRPDPDVHGTPREAPPNVHEVAAAQLAKAASGKGRSAVTLRGGQGHRLRQTLVALTADAELAEHDSPGEATLLVLQGQVHLVAGDQVEDGGPGDLLTIPDRRHALRAVTDAVALLSVSVRD